MQDHEPVIKPASFTPLDSDKGPKKQVMKPLQLVVGTALLCFVLALWFLFTAQSVLLSFEPAEVELDIDGGLQLLVGNRYLLRAGDYDLQVQAEGHHPLRQSLTVGSADRQQFHYKLKRLPGKLSFASNPAGAGIIIDNEMLGKTPLANLSVKAGSHELRVLATRYLPYRQDIDVTGMGQNQHFDLSLEPAWANIAISSEPVGATIYLDGEALANTPALLEILQGDHQIELRLPRYRPWQQSLSVSAGVHQNLQPIVLEPADGILNLSSQPNKASVTVDGEYRGQTPISLELSPADNHRIAVFKPGHSSANRSVSLDPEEQRDMRVKLKPQFGEVLVQVLPEDAEIFVNGASQGSGTRTLSLPAFEQSLEIRRDGFRSHRQRFTPRGGLGQIISVKLITEKDARLAALKPEYSSKGGQILSLFSPAANGLGEFTMGASRREPGRRANEVLHPVSLTRMFYFSHREVSNAEFRKFRQDHNSGRIEGNSLNRARQPVVSVNWNAAALYCNWLSEMEKLPPFYRVHNGEVSGFNHDSHGYRLPSEAEWAWIARTRGDTLLKYPWGEDYPPTEVLENYADHSSAYITGRTVNGYNDGQIVSAPTASFSANYHGVYDMGGNVAEWVNDIYSLADTRGSVDIDPLGAQTGNNHVIRGASWAHGTVTELRLSFRDYGNAGRDDVGFRIARYAEAR